VEELVTRKLEQAVAGNTKIEKLEATTRDGIATVIVHLYENVNDTVEQFADIGQRVTSIPDLPTGAGPVTWVSDFGDTAALMLTVASPKVGGAELRVRGREIERAIAKARGGAAASDRATMLYCLPGTVPTSNAERPASIFAAQAEREGVARDVRSFTAASCVGIDFATSMTDAQLRGYAAGFVRDRLGNPTLHPDAWGPVIVRDPAQTSERLAEVAGDLYSYRQLDDFTDEVARVLRNVPSVAKVSRSGVVGEAHLRQYARSASPPRRSRPRASRRRSRPATRPSPSPAARSTPAIATWSSTWNVRDPSFRTMEDVLVASSADDTPAHLRDLATLSRSYESPALPELPGLARQERHLAAQPRDRSPCRCARATRSGGVSAPRNARTLARAAQAPARSHRRAHERPAASGRGAGLAARGEASPTRRSS
jgi:hypothetical protein